MLGSLCAIAGLLMFGVAIYEFDVKEGLFSIPGMVAGIVAFWGAVASVIAWVCFYFSSPRPPS